MLWKKYFDRYRAIFLISTRVCLFKTDIGQQTAAIENDIPTIISRFYYIQRHFQVPRSKSGKQTFFVKTLFSKYVVSRKLRLIFSLDFRGVTPSNRINLKQGYLHLRFSPRLYFWWWNSALSWTWGNNIRGTYYSLLHRLAWGVSTPLRYLVRTTPLCRFGRSTCVAK